MLLTFEGMSKTPRWAGKGGRILGIPRSPSTEAISPVSSPHTYEPAPRVISSSKAKSVPSTDSPSRPSSRA